MFRCVLYIRLAGPTKPIQFHKFTSEPTTTWEESNETLVAWYTTKSKNGKWEVTGGTIEQHVDGIGWVVCEEPDPEDEWECVDVPDAQISPEQEELR